MLTTTHRKNWPCYEKLNVPQTWIDPLLRLKQWKNDKKFGTWNVRNLYMPSSITTAARELARRKLDLQEVLWDKGGMVNSEDYIFSTEKERKIIN